MDETLEIPARFNGPPGSGHGGYTSGRVAALAGGGSAEVTLRSPPPLERPLAVERDGDAVSVWDGERLVAEARPAAVDLDAPEPVSPEEAARASAAGYERWAARHPFPTCFACGPDRSDDGLRLFPGELGDGRCAVAWTPDHSLAGDDGLVRSEFVWAALDCPSSATVANWGAGPPIVLGRLTASVEAPVQAGRPHAVVSWRLAVDGRKRHTGVALLDAAGGVRALGRGLWIELRQ